MAADISNVPAVSSVGTDNFTQQYENAWQAANRFNNDSHSYAIADSYMQFWLQSMFNQQSMDFQREQSELAYQRSTASAQMQQFIDAGFTEQQARSIIAGANAGAYSPANASIGSSSMADSVAATNADNARYATNVDAAFQGIEVAKQLATMAGSWLSDPSGGVMGAAVANPFVSSVVPFLNDLPPEARSYYGFMNYANSSAAPEELRKLMQSDSAKRTFNSAYGRKFFNQFMKQSYDFTAGDYNLFQYEYQATLAKRDLQIKNLTFDDELKATQAEYMIKQIESDYQTQITPSRIESALAGFRAQFANDELCYQLKSDPQYRKLWLKNQFQDESNALLLGSILNKKYSGQISWLSEGDNSRFVAIGELLDAMGFTRTEIGSVVSTLVMGDFNLPEASKRVANALNQILGLGGSPSVAAQVVSNPASSFGTPRGFTR